MEGFKEMFGNFIVCLCVRDRLRERALIEGDVWASQLDFWVRRGCYKDFAAYMGRTMRLRLEEEPLHRQL